ncbi:MAG: cystathionine gamma-synthase [Bdellovibrionota bacterium]|nr:cystathionine gamma-synthase [Bdellovibrionota bacterium]
MKSRTLSVKAGIESDQQFGSVMPPIYLSSNYTFEDLGKPRRYDYTRSGNPTRDLLGKALGDLEGGKDAVVTSSGMGAVTLLCHLLNPGDLLLAPHDCYGGTHRLFTHLSKKGNFKVQFENQTENNILKEILIKKPKILWIETPSNPLLRIVDIEELSKAAHSVGSIVVVDNTFLSPLLQKPLELGADLVLHSTTKFINGHSDVVGGAVIGKDQELVDQIFWWANCLGLTGSPFDSFLTLRGIRTLAPRISEHQRNTHEIIDFLKTHSLVKKIYYPGLSNHPGHEIAKKQQKGFGSLFSVELSGGLKKVRTFLSQLKLFSLAESLGGVESLIAHPETMTHAGMEEKARREAGITEGLLRISVGIEDSSDLVEDLKQALDYAKRGPYANCL